MNDGNSILDERDSETLELLNVFVTITNPLGQYNNINMIPIPNGNIWHGDKLRDYCEQFIDPNNKNGHVYTYGERLRGLNVDQIQNVINRFNKCTNSRRATCVTLRPHIDSNSEEIPCLIMVDFKIRNNKLDVLGIWRSHDILQAWFPNICGLAYVSKYICDNLGIQLGEISVLSRSAHIYKTSI